MTKSRIAVAATVGLMLAVVTAAPATAGYEVGGVPDGYEVGSAPDGQIWNAPDGQIWSTPDGQIW